MKKIKLVKGMSYKGIVSATKQNPEITVEDKIAEKAVATGYFKVVEEAKKDSKSSFDNMKLDELKAYAAANNIDLQGKTLKPEILAVIKTAVEEKNAAVSNGSPEE